jgi:hypothetical protein
VVPGICTGDETFVVLFCPSCPTTLEPHDHKVPSVLVANELVTPPLIELHVVPGICTGDEISVVVFCPSFQNY